MTELANPGWGALAALLVLIWRIGQMVNATERLDASVARIAKDVGEVVERIRGNVGTNDAAILADCDKLDALSEALEGLGGGEQVGGEQGESDQGGGDTPPAPQEPVADQPQG